MTAYTTIVEAPLEKVWECLVLKIENPQNFVPGVSEVEILEKTSDYVIRQMKVTTPESSVILKEKITFAPYKVRFLLVDHPVLDGYVDNDARAISDTQTELTYTMHWIDKATQTEKSKLEMVQSAVLKTKEFIEKS